MNKTCEAILMVILVLVLLYFGLAGISWQFNNPTANESTFFTYFGDVIRFHSMPEFQIKQGK